MLKLSLPKSVTLIFLILVIYLHCKSCQSAFGNFQEILQTRQQAGRFQKNSEMKLSRQPVFTKMECLDICLRTENCGSFGLRRKPEYWMCLIYRRLNSHGNTPKLIRKYNEWMHVNVSSQELQKVSYFLM